MKIVCRGRCSFTKIYDMSYDLLKIGFFATITLQDISKLHFIACCLRGSSSQLEKRPDVADTFVLFVFFSVPIFGLRSFRCPSIGESVSECFRVSYLGHIVCMSLAYLGHVLGISSTYLGYIFGISWAYLEHILAISWIYLKHILEISWAYLGDILAYLKLQFHENCSIEPKI